MDKHTEHTHEYSLIFSGIKGVIPSRISRQRYKLSPICVHVCASVRLSVSVSPMNRMDHVTSFSKNTSKHRHFHSILGARCCKEHIAESLRLKDGVRMDEALLPNQDNTAVSSKEVSEALNNLRKLLVQTRRNIDFDDLNLLDNEDYIRLTGRI